MDNLNNYLDSLPAAEAPKGGGLAGYLDHLDSLPVEPDPKPAQSGMVRGFKESFQQLPQLGYGLVAGAGAVAENLAGEGGLATGVKNFGVRKYQAATDEMASGAQENDSATVAYEKAKAGDIGALGDWLGHGVGYVGGQALQMAGTAGLGSLAGKAVGRGVVAKFVAPMVEKEALALAATKEGASLTADALERKAVANIASAMGQQAAMAASAVGMEGGEIFGDTVSDAAKEGRSLSGTDLARAGLATLGAAGLEYAEQALGLHALKGKLPLGAKIGAMPGIGGRVARSAAGTLATAPVEGATEFGQTLAEEYGKGKDPLSDETIRGAVDSAAMGALGGATHGVAGGLMHGPLVAPEVKTPVKTPQDHINDIGSATSVDEAIASATAAVSTPTPASPFLAQLQTMRDQIRQGNVLQKIRDSASPTFGVTTPEFLDALSVAQNPTASMEMRQQAMAQVNNVIEHFKTGANMVPNMPDAPEPTSTALATQGGGPLDSPRGGVQFDPNTLDGLTRDVQEIPGQRMLNQPQPGTGLAAQDAAGGPLGNPRQRPAFDPNVIDGQSRFVPDPAELAGTRAIEGQQAAAPARQEPRLIPMSRRAGPGYSLDALTRTPNVQNPAPARAAQEVAAAPAAETATVPAASGLPAAGTAGAVETPRVKDQRLVPVSKRELPAAPAAHFGRSNVPMAEGGKPFKQRAQADEARKLQPQMRIVKVAGGFALTEKTPAQLAAQDKAARRMAQPNTSPAGQPIPAHAFIAAEGGLHQDTRSDLGVQGNPRIGNRTLYAGQGKGLSLEQATEKLVQSGYLREGASHSDTLALVKRSLTNPQYTAEGTERMAEADKQARFEAQQDAIAEVEGLDDNEAEALYASDADWTSIPVEADTVFDGTSNTSTEAAMRALGFTEQEIQDATANQPGISQTDSQGSRGADETPPRSAQEGAGQRSPAPGADQAGRGEGGLTAPTRADILAQQDRAEATEKAAKAQRRADDERARKDQERKDIAARSQSAADTFELGGDAEQNLSGQGDMFGEPAPAAKAATILDAAQVTGKERIEALKDVKAGTITPEELASAYPAKEVDPAAPSEDDAWKALRVISTEKNPGNGVELTSGKFVTEAQAIKAARAAMTPQELTMPFQFNRVLDIAPIDWKRMVKLMKDDDVTQFSRAPATDTPAFRKWFGDDGVTDQDGKPRIFTHSGGDGLNIIHDQGRFGGIFVLPEGQNSNYGNSNYRLVMRGKIASNADLQEFADEHPEKTAAILKQDLDSDAYEDALKIVLNESVDDQNATLVGGIDASDGFAEMQKLRGRLARALGATAVEIKDEFGGDALLIVNGRQVKDIDRNNGQFDPKNPDIRYSAASPEATNQLSPEAKFVASLRAPTGLPTTAVQQAVDALSAKWANAPDVVVIKDLQDPKVPERVRAHDEKQRSQGASGDPEGFFYGGKVYLLASQLHSEADVSRVLFHEALGHFGLRGVFGDSLKPMLDQISLGRRSEVAKKAAEYGLDMGNQKQRREAAEEVLAELAQTHPELGVVKRAIAAIRTWLREHVPGFNTLRVSDSEILRNYILPARAWVERSQQAEAQGLPAFSRSKVIGETTRTHTPEQIRAKINAFTRHATDTLNENFSHPGKLSWWDKSVGSMYHLAERSAPFKRVFDAAQGFINDTAFYASDAASLAPKLLPKLESWADMLKTPISAEDNKAISAPIFEGTLGWRRDSNGKPVKVLPTDGESVRAGVAWTDAELKATFGLNPAQIGLYREYHAAIGRSLNNLAKAEMLRFVGKDAEGMERMVMDAPDAATAAEVLRRHMLMLADEEPTRANVLEDTATGLTDRADRVAQLQAEGYAPLSRFGRYSVDVVVDGKREYFNLFESVREANKMALKLKIEFGSKNVAQGTISQREFEQFKGITPESAELFGNMLNLDSTGDKESDAAFQTFLKLTKNNRSAMKRLIHRKGIAGFSEDAGRTLAAFVYSNARQTAAALNMGELGRAVADIPKGQGELKDVAIGLASYIQNPQEEAQAVRGFMFAQYLGGSVASAFVNFTQPVAVSLPYLSQFGGARKAGAELLKAMKDQRPSAVLDAGLARALHQAEEQGVVAPQEVHQLMAQARGASTLKAGDGTQSGNAMAAAGNHFAKLMLGWGKLFGMAEQINRRTTFIAAYRIGEASGVKDPAAFATKAVNETQFINNKANKPRWARGAVGATLMTFKSYSLNYLELVHRLATQNGPEGKKAAALMLGMLMLMAGAGGLPFEDDIEDVVDAVAQRLGYNFSSKKAKQEFLEDLFGKAGAQFVDKGLTGLPGSPIDVSGRMSMGNLIPGTGLLLNKRDHTSDVQELAGPMGDLVKRTFQSADQALSGNLGQAALMLAPKAVGNFAKGMDMAGSGMYKDAKGYKVLETSDLEAAMKMVGFQPASVAEVQEGNYLNQRAKDFYSLTAQDISARWANGVFEKDMDQIQQARDQLAAWNENNPDQPMKANLISIYKKAREMSKPKDQRIADTAPKSMRAQMRQDIAERRLDQL